LTISQTADITGQPDDQETVCQGASYSTSVTSPGASTYQWYKDAPNTNNPVAGQDGATLSLSNLQPSQSGSYYCYVTGACGSAWSNAFALTVNPAATATSITLGTGSLCQGTSTSVSASFGGGATDGNFSDGGVGGTFSVTKNGSLVAGTYTPPASYTGPVTITFTTNDPDGPCPGVSSLAAFTVIPAPILSKVSASPNPICEGNTLLLQADASGGTGALTYDWSGPGGYDPTPTTINPQARTDATGAFAGNYAVTVTDQNGCQASGHTDAAKVLNLTAVQHLTRSQSICANQPFTVAVQAVGDNLTYQWYRQVGSNLTQAIPGATSAEVRLTSQHLPGTFFVNIGGTCGPVVTSPTFTIGHKPPTTLRTTSTVSQVCEGGNLTLAVSGSGPGTLSYAWRRGDPNGPVLGTGTSFTVSNAQPADAGTYHCTLTSECTTAQVSIPVTVRHVRLTTQPQPANLCSGSTTLTVGVQAVGVTPAYQWKRNSQNITGATSASLTVQANRPGTYTVDVRTSCVTLTSQEAVVSCTTNRLAGESAEAPTLEIAPNPAGSNLIRCLVSGLDAPTFNLTTTTGRSIGLSAQPDGPGVWLLTPRQSLAAGVYVVQAREGNALLTRRVLVTD